MARFLQSLVHHSNILPELREVVEKRLPHSCPLRALPSEDEVELRRGFRLDELRNVDWAAFFTDSIGSPRQMISPRSQRVCHVCKPKRVFLAISFYLRDRFTKRVWVIRREGQEVWADTA